jgi:hypothetical protein
VELKLNAVDDLVLLHVLGGIENPSLARRVTALADQCAGRDLLLDLTRFGKETVGIPDTALIRRSIQLRKSMEGAGRKMAVLVPPSPDDRIFSLGLFDPAMICSSVHQALEQMGKLNLQAKTEKLVRHP